MNAENRNWRNHPFYPAFVEWINAPITVDELKKNDLAIGEPRIEAYEGTDPYFLFLLWKAAKEST